MEYTTVTNLRWCNRQHSTFKCDVTFTKLGTVPFTPTADDSEAHGREIYARCMAGEFGPIADYVLQPDEYPVIITPAGRQTQGSQTQDSQT